MFNINLNSREYTPALSAPAARRAAAALQKRGGYHIDSDDILQDAELLKLEFEATGKEAPEAAYIQAVVLKTNLQTLQKSIICGVSLSQENDNGDTIDIAADECEEIEKWRLSDIDIDIAQARSKLTKNGCLTDRRARQILAKQAQKVAAQNDFFGFAAAEGGSA